MLNIYTKLIKKIICLYSQSINYNYLNISKYMLILSNWEVNLSNSIKKLLYYVFFDYL